VHDYSINRHPKEKILFVLALIAIVSAPLLNQGIANLFIYFGGEISFASSSLTAVPVFGVFMGIYMLFDKCLWKLEWLCRFLLVPDLNGAWKCVGKTVLKNGAGVSYDWSGKITITQSWSKMLIHLETKQSVSISIAASIAYVEGVGYKVLYEYQNAPAANHIELSKHSGTTELLFDLHCKSAAGNYYTDQHRQTVGAMELMREQTCGN
jgi:hypothetical protein